MKLSKVVSIESRATHRYDGFQREAARQRAEQLYRAAARVFSLPKYGQVIGFLKGGPLPDTPPDVMEDVSTQYCVGLMHQPHTKMWGDRYVSITTAGGRIIEVTEVYVTVHFRTNNRAASVRAAKQVLGHLQEAGATGEDYNIFLEDGICLRNITISPEDFYDEGLPGKAFKAAHFRVIYGR